MNTDSSFLSSWWRLFFFLLACVALTGPAGLLDAEEARPAPDWSLTDLNGHEVSSSQFKGKVLIVDFWATWCGPCVQEIPGYVDLQKKYGKEGLAIVGVSLDRAGADKVRKFAEEHGMNYTVAMGDSDIVEKFGGFNAIPTTFLIDRQGRIVHRKTGSWPHEKYEQLVKGYLNGK